MYPDHQVEHGAIPGVDQPQFGTIYTLHMHSNLDNGATGTFPPYPNEVWS